MLVAKSPLRGSPCAARVCSGDVLPAGPNSLLKVFISASWPSSLLLALDRPPRLQAPLGVPAYSSLMQLRWPAVFRVCQRD